MREIKFRAWHKITKQFIDLNGFSIAFGNMRNKGEVYSITEQGVLRETAIEQVEIMQYTGLHDKNGKEIYEGDIVRFFVSHGAEGIPSTEEMQSNVHYANGLLYPMADFMYDHYIYEVIGNIYENPELLEGL